MKRLFSLSLFSYALCISLNATVYSGNCGAEGDGSNLQWSLETETGALNVTGSGAMQNYTHGSYPALTMWDPICPVRTVSLSNELISIGAYAFFRCKDLTSVTIPNSVTAIGNNAFCVCTSLAGVIIPNSVVSIGGGAFMSSSLTSVNIPSSVTEIGYAVFTACPLTSILVDVNNANYCDVNGVLFNKDTTRLMQYPVCKQITEYVMPSRITSIDSYAFYGCTSLTSITFGNSVTTIGEACFMGCTSLTKVQINDLAAWCATSYDGEGANPLEYAHHLYLNNAEIKDLVIPATVTSIGKCAFYGCSGLTTVTIPHSVTSIGDYAFNSCSGLISITCEAVIPPICNFIFSGVDKSIPLYVPAGSIDAYKTNDRWGEFTNILPIQEAIETMITDIQAEPADNSVVIEWPKVDEATIYTIEIKKNGELICTLTFNELGQLQSIAFAKPSRNSGRDSQVRIATQTTTGWQYTIAGLEPNTTYTYNVIAKRNASDTDNLYDKTITFTTKNTPTNIDAVVGVESQSKQIHNGQLYILRDGEIYNVQGARVE